MNIAHRISSMAEKFPDKKSVVFSPDNSFYTFKKFESRSNQMAHAFQKLGIKKGTRTLLFVKPCLDFSVITFALFKMGAIPVLIDPGMGLKNLLSSIKQVKPEALISIGKVHWLRRIKRADFSSVKINLSMSDVGGRTSVLKNILKDESENFEIVPVSSEDHAAILFTSGGTGIPKGVQYTHGILNAQTDALKNMFSLDENEIDLPGFPLFALFTLAMGMTSVIPDMDPTKPAQCDPKKIVRNILEHQVTFVAGSPAIWERVGEYCVKHNIVLGSLKYVVMFGAPVRGTIHKLFKKILPFGDTYTPYGATECLPVSLISGSEVLSHTIQRSLQGEGTCIGRPIQNTRVEIIKASDIPVDAFFPEPRNAIGEIVVSGPQVTPSYFEMEEETRLAKIHDGSTLWHRMGDMGKIDQDGRLWFLGRKAHVVKTESEIFYPIEVEIIFNSHPMIKRSALIGITQDQKIVPAIVIEGENFPKDFWKTLQDQKNKNVKTRLIDHFFWYPKFPVDVRHNIKIDRTKLSKLGQTGELHKILS